MTAVVRLGFLSRVRVTSCGNCSPFVTFRKSGALALPFREAPSSVLLRLRPLRLGGLAAIVLTFGEVAPKFCCVLAPKFCCVLAAADSIFARDFVGEKNPEAVPAIDF